MPAKKHSLDFEKPLLDLEKQLEDLLQSSQDSDLDFSDEIKAIEKKIDSTKREVYSDLTSWQKVQLSRHPNRPFSLDYIDRIFSDFQPFAATAYTKRTLRSLVVRQILMVAK